MHILSTAKSFIIDMDGVLWHGNNPTPGLTDFFNCLRQLDIPFILATNNASHTPQQYQSKLKQLGVSVSLSEILTSGIATAFYLSQHYTPEETSIYVIGEAGATQPLSDLGFNLINAAPDHSSAADLVVCGKDETLTWNKLANASLHLRAGAKFFGTNGDTSLPTEQGIILGNGAILAALETATGCTPTIIGKPEAIIYQQAIKLLGTNLEQTIAIGDRLDTDILGAVRTGIKSILVLSGVSTEQDLNTVDYRPTWIMDDIRDITHALQQ